MRLKQTSGIRRVLAATAAVMLLWSFPVLAVSQTEEMTKPAARELTVRTYRNVPYRASFLSADGKNEDLTYTIVKAPKRGTVTVEGAEFLYIPAENKTGRDSFTYTATDAAGKVAEEGKVSVVIEKPKRGVEYSDMENSPALAAAIQLAEKGIFTGLQIGEKYYFEPEHVVSRSEFLAMTMEMAGMKAPPVTMTGFCDDDAIPVWAKAYAASGLGNGVVQGRVTAEGIAFGGGEPITFNQAAAILDRVLSVSNVDLAVWYADRDAVPSWAAQAVANMESLCVMSVGSFGSGTLNTCVTRADAARLLCNAAALLEGKGGELPSWLS